MDLEGAIVIIGATAHSLGDFHATPFANGTLASLVRAGPRLMSGPELQANVVVTLADGAFITTPWWLTPLPQVLLLGALLGWSFARLTLTHGFILAFVHHWVWKGVALAAFVFGSWHVEVVAMLMTGLLAYGAIFALRWRRLRAGMLGMVKGDVLAGLLEDEGHHTEIAGEERNVTVLFSDIRGFTRHSSQHSARETVTLLNAYFNAVVPIIERHGGMVDKYIGDGIMAIFGAPSDQPDHAQRAVRASVAVVAHVHALDAQWVGLDFPHFRIGVGVASGPAVVGVIGSRGRMDFTAIGDTVNAAARIESANKEYGTEILISTRTRNALEPEARRQLGCAETPVLATAHGIPEGLMVYPVSVNDGRAPAPPEESHSQPASSAVQEPTP